MNKNWLILLLFLIVIIICYGLLTPWLGFYFDDWPLIFLYKTEGISGFVDFLEYDRPLSIWTFALTFPIIGTSRLGWQISALIMRWFAVVTMWWTLSGLWPDQKRKVTWMAMIFAVYPVFFQQPISVIYCQVFIIYSIFFLSIGFMVWAYRIQKYYWLLTILSWITAALHMFTMEYFVGLELLRPIILWFVLSEGYSSGLDRLKKTIKIWLPFVFILIAYIVWRFLFLQLPEGSNTPVLLTDFQAFQFSSFLPLLETVFKDVTYLLAYSWSLTLEPEKIIFSQPFILLSWLIVFGVIVGLSYFMKHSTIFECVTGSDESNNKQSLIVGIFGILVGFSPVWIAGRSLVGRSWTDRFSIAAMFGASILVVSLITILLQKNTHKIIVISVLVGLAIGAHLRSENEYRWDWTEQAQFYWQLYWRAPRIKTGTSIMNEEALFSYASKYSAATAINTLYSTSISENKELPLWVFEFEDEFAASIDNFIEGEVMEAGIRNLNFSGQSNDSLVIYYEPIDNPGACLWVLSPTDKMNLDLPQFTSQVVLSANIDRINIYATHDWKPDRSIFGSEPKHNWCYYYQKANLAKQTSDWNNVVVLFEEAKKSGFRPLNSYEIFPFVEGYAFQGDWEKAQEITRDAYKRHVTIKQKRDFQAMICYVWNSLENNTLSTSERNSIIEEIYQMANCK
jgi:hypothetical protein